MAMSRLLGELTPDRQTQIQTHAKSHWEKYQYNGRTWWFNPKSNDWFYEDTGSQDHVNQREAREAVAPSPPFEPAAGKRHHGKRHTQPLAGGDTSGEAHTRICSCGLAPGGHTCTMRSGCLVLLFLCCVFNEFIYFMYF